MTQINNEGDSYIHMDFSLEKPEDRVKKVEEIIANTPPERLTPKYLEKLSDYIIFAMDKQERKQKNILTDNHLITVNARETSFEGLIGKLENGEDGIYNMITNDKNIIFHHKSPITQADLDEIPELKKLHEEIIKLEEVAKTARGARAYNLKKQIIEMRKDQYVIRSAYRKPMYCMNLIKSITKMDLYENICAEADGSVTVDAAVSLLVPEHVSALLCNYSKIKEDSWDKFSDDSKWLMEDLDALVEKTLKDKYPLYFDLLIYKIDGLQNAEIQKLLEEKYGIKHSVEYLSSLWRKKIPKMLAETATNDWLLWHYTEEERGVWKKCSRCGQIKLAHNNFFSKNKTSRDGFYSICKECRNKKTK